MGYGSPAMVAARGRHRSRYVVLNPGVAIQPPRLAPRVPDEHKAMLATVAMADSDHRVHPLRLQRLRGRDDAVPVRPVEGHRDAQREKHGLVRVEPRDDCLGRGRLRFALAAEDGMSVRWDPGGQVCEEFCDVGPSLFIGLAVETQCGRRSTHRGRIMGNAPSALESVVINPFDGQGLPPWPDARMRVADGKRHAGRTGILITCGSKACPQIFVNDYTHHAAAAPASVRLPHPRLLGTAQVVLKVQLVERLMRQPWPALLECNTTLHTLA